MSRQIPEYLRLHVEETVTAIAPASEDARGALDELCKSFRRATGWSLSHGKGPAPLQSPEVLWARTLPRDAQQPSHLAICRSPGKSASDLQNELLPLCDLVDSVAELIGNCYQTERALIEREAELALGVPLVSHRDEDSHLSKILEAVLQAGCEAIDVQAAGLYLLDDGTSQLKLRARWGLPNERFLEPARDLRGAVADLEALTGSAVAIEDVSLLPHWKVPEPCASALCIPVATSTTPLGTLWFFGDCVREYSQRQTNLAEIIAGRIAVELERQILLGEVERQRDPAAGQEALRQMHDEQLPIGPIATDEWEVAAVAHQGREGPNEFYDWAMHDDASLSVILAETHGQDLASAMTLQLLRGSTKSAMLEGLPPARVVRNAAEVAWSSTTGADQATLAVLRLPANNEEIEFCSAGQVGALIVRSDRPTAMGQGAPALASDPDASYHAAKHAVNAGEAVILVSDTIRRSLNADGEQLGEAAIAECALENLHCDAERLAHVLFDLWREHTADKRQPVSILVAKRRQ